MSNGTLIEVNKQAVRDVRAQTKLEVMNFCWSYSKSTGKYIAEMSTIEANHLKIGTMIETPTGYIGLRHMRPIKENDELMGWEDENHVIIND